MNVELNKNANSNFAADLIIACFGCCFFFSAFHSQLRIAGMLGTTSVASVKNPRVKSNDNQFKLDCVISQDIKNYGIFSL